MLMRLLFSIVTNMLTLYFFWEQISHCLKYTWGLIMQLKYLQKIGTSVFFKWKARKGKTKLMNLSKGICSYLNLNCFITYQVHDLKHYPSFLKTLRHRKKSLDVITGCRWNRPTNLTNHRAAWHLSTSAGAFRQLCYWSTYAWSV